MVDILKSRAPSAAVVSSGVSVHCLERPKAGVWFPREPAAAANWFPREPAAAANWFPRETAAAANWFPRETEEEAYRAVRRRGGTPPGAGLVPAGTGRPAAAVTDERGSAQPRSAR